MIKWRFVFILTVLMVNTMAYGQELENKRALIFLGARIFPQAYLQNLYTIFDKEF